MKNQRQKIHLHKIKDHGRQWITSIGEIEKEAISAFQSQLNEQHTMKGEILLNHISALVSYEENELPCASPTLEELKETILDMNGESATS